MIHVKVKWDDTHDATPYDFRKAMIRTAVHEINHTIMNETSEHPMDPFPADPSGGPLDLREIMYGLNPSNNDIVVFSDLTRGWINLTSKQGVER